MTPEIKGVEVDSLCRRLDKEAEEGGYHLNPDVEFTKALVKSLMVNERRYGYWACPCRLASGRKEEDSDIICPCDYRDADVGEYGACYCALYVSAEVLRGERKAESIPERRPPREARQKMRDEKRMVGPEKTALAYPVWRCKVCGYLCARDQPPEVCPICRAKKDRFEIFMQ